MSARPGSKVGMTYRTDLLVSGAANDAVEMCGSVCDDEALA